MMTPDRIFIHFFSAQYPVRCLMCVCVFVCLLFSNFFLVFFWLIKIFKKFFWFKFVHFYHRCLVLVIFFIFYFFLIWFWMTKSFSDLRLIDWLNKSKYSLILKFYKQKKRLFSVFFFRFNLCQLLWWFSTTTTTTTAA